MFESLTAFIPDLEKGDFGDWTEQTGDGTPEKPLVFCHIEYSEPVRKLIDTLFRFGDAHGEEMRLNFYPAIMDEIRARGQGKDLLKIDLSVLDGRLVVGFLLYMISMCRFNDSLFLDLCKAGTVLRCLKRLKEIDDNGEDAVSAPAEREEPKEPYPIPVRDLVRGEVSPEYFMRGEEEILELDYDDEYRVTAEDLLAGIRNMKPDARLAARWLDELLFCDEDIWPEEVEDEGSGRLLREGAAVLCSRELLDEALYNPEDDDPERFAKALAEAEKVLQAWLDIGGNPTRASEYPDAMLRWIVDDDDEGSINRRNTERQNTFVKCLDELCRRGDVEAVAKRGYCYYCGTDLYGQNWEAARDAFLYVYEKTGAAWAANTLGYICYYGRCNGGVPEYDEAFRWFSIGHAGGIEESTYKLGDLFANGFGVRKNGDIAWNLYQEVYDETLAFFLKGYTGSKFADAAIRMGNCYRDGLGCAANPEEAYAYYLQARMALKMRMDACMEFGDDSVWARLKETMSKIREDYTEHAKELKSADPFWLEWMLDKDHRACRMTWRALKDGSISLSFTRAPGTDNASDLFLVTFPAGDYCDLLSKVTVRTEKGAELIVGADDREVVFEDYSQFESDRKIVLFRDGKKVAEIRTKGFCFRPANRMMDNGSDLADQFNDEESDKQADKLTRKKEDPPIETLVYMGKENRISLAEKQPLRVSPVHDRLLKEYNSIDEFQKDYPTAEKREAFAGKLMNYEIDELVNLCGTVQGKCYYEKLKKQEKVFEFRKHPVLCCLDDGDLHVAVYDGPGTEKFAEYVEGTQKSGTVRLSVKDIRAIKAAVEDNVLFETEHLEDPYQSCILDGMFYGFFFAVKGCENEMSGYNIGECRMDYEHCIHSAHAICALEEIRSILMGTGVPKKYLEL